MLARARDAQSTPSDWDALRRLHAEAIALRREALLANPLLDFHRLLASKRRPDGDADERPPGIVEVRQPFWMAECEVTNEQYAQFDPRHDSRFEHRSSLIFGESSTSASTVVIEEGQPAALAAESVRPAPETASVH